jgi:hypothetical protein
VRLIEADAGERDDGGLEGVEAHLRVQVESKVYSNTHTFEELVHRRSSAKNCGHMDGKHANFGIKKENAVDSEDATD